MRHAVENASAWFGRHHWLALSGPEGGFTPEEEVAAVAQVFVQISLGDLVLRADTAPLA